MKNCLLVDIGNTCLKYRIDNNDVVVIKHVDSDLLACKTSAWSKLAKPEHILVASVADQKTNLLISQCCETLWKLSPQFVLSRTQCLGLTCAYADPKKLGVDRWLAMLAAWHKTQAAVCVIDCGSAITVDAVDDNGKHLGGMIFPGVNALRASLLNNTQLTTNQIHEFTALDLGTDTNACVANGISIGVLGFIQQAILVTSNKLPKFELIFTGGDAVQISPLVAQPHKLVNNLVLDGLMLDFH